MNSSSSDFSPEVDGSPDILPQSERPMRPSINDASSEQSTDRQIFRGIEQPEESTHRSIPAGFDRTDRSGLEDRTERQIPGGLPVRTDRSGISIGTERQIPGGFEVRTEREIPAGFEPEPDDSMSDFSMSVESECGREEEIKIPDSSFVHPVLPDAMLSPQTQRDIRLPPVEQEKRDINTDRVPALRPIEQADVQGPRPPVVLEPPSDRSNDFDQIASPQQEYQHVFPAAVQNSQGDEAEADLDIPIQVESPALEEAKQAIQPVSATDIQFSSSRFDLPDFLNTPLQQSVCLTCKISRISSTLGFSTTYVMKLSKSGRFL